MAEIVSARFYTRVAEVGTPQGCWKKCVRVTDCAGRWDWPEYWDSAGAESLWSTFKHEYYYRHTFAAASELVAAVDRWMHFYNTRRRHSTIGMLSPVVFEQSQYPALLAA